MTWNELIEEIQRFTEAERQQEVRIRLWDDDGYRGWAADLERSDHDMPSFKTWDDHVIAPGFIRKDEPFLC